MLLDTGHCLKSQKAAVKLRHEAIEEKKILKESKFDVWALVFVRRALRVFGPRTECFKIASEDPVTAKFSFLALSSEWIYLQQMKWSN